MIKIKDYTYSYKDNKDCIKNINMEFQKGFMYAIVGPSGSGKTTLFMSLIGYAKGKGSIKVGNSFNPIDFSKHIATYLPIESIVQISTGLEADTEASLTVQLDAYKLHRSKTLSKKASNFDLNLFNKYIRIFKLTEKNEKLIPAKKLSRGELALFELAYTLSFDTDVYLLDEPFSNIDYILKNEVMNCLKEKVVNGKTVILSSHNIKLLDGSVDYIYFLKDSTNLEIIETTDIEDELPELYNKIYQKEEPNND